MRRGTVRRADTPTRTPARPADATHNVQRATTTCNVQPPVRNGRPRRRVTRGTRRDRTPRGKAQPSRTTADVTAPCRLLALHCGNGTGTGPYECWWVGGRALRAGLVWCVGARPPHVSVRMLRAMSHAVAARAVHAVRRGGTAQAPMDGRTCCAGAWLCIVLRTRGEPRGCGAQHGPPHNQTNKQTNKQTTNPAARQCRRGGRAGEAQAAPRCGAETLSGCAARPPGAGPPGLGGTAAATRNARLRAAQRERTTPRRAAPAVGRLLGAPDGRSERDAPEDDVQSLKLPQWHASAGDRSGTCRRRPGGRVGVPHEPTLGTQMRTRGPAG